MIFIYLITPVVIIIAGVVLHFTANVNINSLYGFRTKTSSASKETWEYCNKLCAKFLIITGAAAAAALFIAGDTRLFGFHWGDIISLSMVAVILVSIPIINGCCKRKFPELFKK